VTRLITLTDLEDKAFAEAARALDGQHRFC
jgi:hypothetical protein